MKSLVWAVTQQDGSTGEGIWRQIIQRKDQARTEGEGGPLQAKGRGLPGSLPSLRLQRGLVASRNVRK